MNMSISDALMMDAEWWLCENNSFPCDGRVDSLRELYGLNYITLSHMILEDDEMDEVDCLFSLLIREAIKYE